MNKIKERMYKIVMMIRFPFWIYKNIKELWPAYIIQSRNAKNIDKYVAAMDRSSSKDKKINIDYLIDGWIIPKHPSQYVSGMYVEKDRETEVPKSVLGVDVEERTRENWPENLKKVR